MKSLYDFIVENEIFLENTDEDNQYYKDLIEKIISDKGLDGHISREDITKQKKEITYQLTNSNFARMSYNDIEKLADEFCRRIKEKIIRNDKFNEITIQIIDEEKDIKNKIILRGHGAKYEKTNENIEKQEKIQMFCIKNNFYYTSDNIDSKTKKKLNNKVKNALIQNHLLTMDDPEEYIIAGIKTATAWHNYYKKNNINVSYPTDTDENSIASYISKKRYKDFEGKPGNINEWNPADIYISTINLDDLKDEEEKWFNEKPENIKKITEYNEFLNYLILEQMVFPVSLKMNTVKGNKSIVHEMNVKRNNNTEKKSKAELGRKNEERKSKNGYMPVITSTKGIIINILLDDLPYSYCFRSFGDTYSVEAKNGKMTDTEISNFKSKHKEEEPDILVRNITSSLGKAKATLSIVMPNLKLDSKNLTDKILVINNDDYPLLKAITTDKEIKANKCKDPKIIALFNAWIIGMKNLIDSLNGDESEALCYTKYAAEKRNYGKMFAFAPYIKIA